MTDETPQEEKQTQQTQKKTTVTEQIEVKGSQLVDRVKELVAEGNVRRLIFRAPDDSVMMEMTVTTGAVLGGAITLAAWWLAALGAIAALVARVRIEIVREVPEDEVEAQEAPPTDADRPASTGKQKVKIQVEDDDGSA